MEIGRTFSGLIPSGEDSADERARYLAGLVKAHLRKRGDQREVRPLLPGMEPARQQAGPKMRMMAGAPTAAASFNGSENVRRGLVLLLANRHGPM